MQLVSLVFSCCPGIAIELQHKKARASQWETHDDVVVNTSHESADILGREDLIVTDSEDICIANYNTDIMVVSVISQYKYSCHSLSG